MKYTLILILLSATLASAQVADDHTADVKAIVKLNQQLLRAYNMGDWKTLDRIEDDDFTLAGDFGEVPKKEHLEQVRNKKDHPSSVSVSLYRMRFRFYGDTALMSEIDKYGNPPIEPGFKTSSVWVKRGGDWKVVHLHYTRLAPKS